MDVKRWKTLSLVVETLETVKCFVLESHVTKISDSVVLLNAIHISKFKGYKVTILKKIASSIF